MLPPIPKKGQINEVQFRTLATEGAIQEPKGDNVRPLPVTATDAVDLNAPVRRAWRTAGVIVMAALVIGLTFPNVFINNWDYLIPISLGNDWSVTAVYPPADASLRVHDTIVPSSLTPDGRLTVFDVRALPPGSTLRFTVARSGRSIGISVQSPRNQLSTTPIVTWVKRLSASLFIIIGALLVLRRPCRMTWGFFLFALGSNFGAPYILQYLAPSSFDAGYFLINIVFGDGLWTAGLWMFTARFPSDVATGWRAKIDRLAPFAGLIAFVAGTLSYLAIYQGWRSFQTWYNANFWISEALLAVGILSLLGGYFEMSASERQRLKWVVAGFAIYYGAVAYLNLAPYLPGGGWPASWTAAGYTIDILSVTCLFIPATVVYAVLRHHVLDVNFVISRALVFGTLTTIVVGVFAIIDWFFSKVVQQQRLAFYADLAFALAFGFGLDGMHRRVDKFIDRVLYRQRHLAEARLDRVAAGISHMTSDRAVDTALVDEPAHALDLVSAAIFRRQDGKGFSRVASVGWATDATEELPADDPILLHMQGERGPLRLRHIKRRADNFPKKAAVPIIAFPLLVRHQLEGLALYGAHVTGEDIDPDEVRILERLATSAAAAYDHIEAQNLRSKFQDIQDKLTAAQVKIDALMASENPHR